MSIILMGCNKPKLGIKQRHNSWTYIEQKRLYVTDSVAFPRHLRSTIAESYMAPYILSFVSIYLNMMDN